MNGSATNNATIRHSPPPATTTTNNGPYSNSSSSDGDHNSNDDDSHGGEDDILPTSTQAVPFYKLFYSTAVFNLASLILPALYSTLSKLWVARIDASLVATTDAHTYLGVMIEVLNEGLPRAAWVVIGDASSRTLPQRLTLTHTLILTQSALGLAMSIALAASAPALTRSFVPGHVRRVSVDYVRITAFTALTSAIETAVATATRALDRPDVPLVISSAKFAANIILDLLLVSPVHVGPGKPSVLRQASILLSCNAAAAAAGVVYFYWRTATIAKPTAHNSRKGTHPSLAALLVLVRPGLFTLAESAIRNVLYLWLVTTIVAMGTTYATAWGVFNTIRWGLVMVPVQALEQTSLALTGHAWGALRSRIGISTRRLSRSSFPSVVILPVLRPSLTAAFHALALELLLCAFMSAYGARPFARYLSGSEDVASVSARMWRTLDWCYILYGVSTQLATVLLATRPRWYLWQSLASNALYVLPWAVVCQAARARGGLDAAGAWTYHSLVFGGSLVFSFFDIAAFVCVWAWALMTGRMTLEVFRR